MTRTRSAFVLASLLLAFVGARSAGAHESDLLSFIDLPPGFGPEGIAAGRGLLYVSNLRDGSVLTVDPRSGSRQVLVPPATGRFALGLALDQRTNNLFIADGPNGHLYVHDAISGAQRADYALASGTTIINAVVVTHDTVYVTDSANPAIYALPLGPAGRLPPPGAVRTIPLGGDFPVIPRAFNANGIVAAPNGGELIVVHTAAGKLFRVDPDTGLARTIDLGGGSVPNGDGLLLRGHTLYVVQNFSNQVAVVALAPDLRSGSIVRTITDPRFDVITSAALVADGLYLTNARYTTRPTPETIYSLVRVPLGCDEAR